MSEGIEPGYWVGLALSEAVSGSRYWVGQVQHVDERGVRVTLVDWLTGTASGWDFYAPWSNILGVHIATPDHDISGFAESAGQFQSRHDDNAADKTPPKPAT